MVIDKKGISSVIAIVLILVIGIVSVISFQNWYNQFTSELYLDVEQKSTPSKSIELESLVGSTLYVKGSSPTNLTNLRIGGTDCSINESIGKKIKGIDISSCLENVSDSNFEVFVQTDGGNFSSKFFYSDLTNNSSTETQENEQKDLSNAFLTVWKTDNPGPSDNDQIELPLESAGSYNFTVSANNLMGSPVRITNYTENILTFSEPGIYNMTIQGEIEGFRFGRSWDDFRDAEKLLEIKQWGSLSLKNYGTGDYDGAFFVGTKNLTITATDTLNTSGLITMKWMFRESGISQVPNMNNWDVSSVTNMWGMFYDTYSFDQDISSWDVNNVTDMSYMFIRTSFDQDISSWEVGNVTSMRTMFYGTPFDQDISSWDVSSVTNMESIFRETSNFNQNISSWNTSSVTNMNRMLMQSSFNQDISSWDTSNVTDMARMFYRASSFNQNISNWCVELIDSKPSNFDYNAHSNFENNAALQPNWGEIC